MDLFGKIMEKIEDNFGREYYTKIMYKILYSLLMKVTVTRLKQFQNKGKKKFIVQHGTFTKTQSAMNDQKLTILLFTNANSERVVYGMCCYISKKDERTINKLHNRN